MFRLRTIVIATTMALAACSQQPNGAANPPAPAAASASSTASATTDMTSNPFYRASTLPFQAPPFDRIHDGDYQPAIEEGMRQHLAEIEKIADNPEPPTFENTYVAMEKSGAMLHRVMAAFDAVTGANTSDTLQKVQEEEAPKLAAHEDAIHLNGKLFQRVETIYEQRDTLKLDAESARLVEVVYKNFVHAGAKLSDADKAKLKDLNKEESTLSTAFTNKLLAATKDAAPVIADKAKLAGLSDAELAAATQAGHDRKLDGKYVLTLQNTTQQPELQDITDRATRQALFEASWNRAEKSDANDTRKTIERLAQIRAAQAKLLGFPNYAAWKLDDQMAKTPQTALKFMQNLVPAATARAKVEAGDIQALIAKQHGDFKLQPWDWNFYAEQVRKAKYDLDENADQAVLRAGQRAAERRVLRRQPAIRADLQGAPRHPGVPAGRARVRGVRPRRHARWRCSIPTTSSATTRTAAPGWTTSSTQSKLLGTKPVIFNVVQLQQAGRGRSRRCCRSTT